MEKLEEDHSGAAEIIRAWNEKVDAAEGEYAYALKLTEVLFSHYKTGKEKLQRERDTKVEVLSPVSLCHLFHGVPQR